MASKTIGNDDDNKLDPQLPKDRDGKIGQTHLNQVKLSWIRKGFQNELVGRDFSVQHIRGKGLSVVVTPALEADAVPYMQSTSSVGSAPLLTNTSKMVCPSYSLPAGVPGMGGSCPGATAGQTYSAATLGRKSYLKSKKIMLDVLNTSTPKSDRTMAKTMPDDMICQHCYATGGNYMKTQQWQVIRYAWQRWAIANGTFAPTLIQAIQEAQWHIEQPQWAKSGWRFFRIHDSGDFTDAASIAAWKQVADAFAEGNKLNLPKTMFWAPTRIWTLPRHIKDVNRINGGKNWRGNFIIRPSAMMVDDFAPDLTRSNGKAKSGWSAGSTVVRASVIKKTPDRKQVFHHNCPVYSIDDSGKKNNCANAMSPTGKLGCRACWTLPGHVVNYTLH